MTTFKRYGIWKRVLAQWLSATCPTRRTNLTWRIVGLYVSGTVQTSAIVQRWPMALQVSSLTRRLSRFLDNGAVRPAVWFRPVARQLRARAAPHRLTLIVEARKVGAGHPVVIVSLADQHRALPLAWTWVPDAKGAVATDIQLALFKRVHGLLPKGGHVIWVGEAGCSSVLVLRQLEAWGWDYVRRQKGKFLLPRSQPSDWERRDSLLTAAGQQVWLVAGGFTAKWQPPLRCWPTGRPGPSAPGC
jgi:hypothetical protein